VIKITWKEAVQDLGYESLVRSGTLYLGFDLGTSEAKVVDLFPVGSEAPDSEKGKKILSEIREKIGK